MKRIVIAIVVILGLGTGLSSCRSHRSPCPAYRIPNHASINTPQHNQNTVVVTDAATVLKKD